MAPFFIEGESYSVPNKTILHRRWQTCFQLRKTLIFQVMQYGSSSMVYQLFMNTMSDNIFTQSSQIAGFFLCNCLGARLFPIWICKKCGQQIQTRHVPEWRININLAARSMTRRCWLSLKDFYIYVYYSATKYFEHCLRFFCSKVKWFLFFSCIKSLFLYVLLLVILLVMKVLLDITNFLRHRNFYL